MSGDGGEQDVELGAVRPWKPPPPPPRREVPPQEGAEPTAPARRRKNYHELEEDVDDDHEDGRVHAPPPRLMKHGRRRLAVLLTPLLVVGVLAAVLFVAYHGRGAGVVGYTHGAVAADEPQCSEMGAEVMEAQGGNAVDAMVTVALCQGVKNMFASGIGGGGYALVRMGGVSRVYDFREEAPAALTLDAFADDPSLSTEGGLAVGVPGEVLGLETMHRAHGALPWADVVRPAADLARAGFKVSRELNARISHTLDVLRKHAVLREHFLVDGEPPAVGSTMTRAALANTLDVIADKGAHAFYEGEIADTIVADVRAAGGVVTHADLAAYAVRVHEPLESTYHDLTVLGVPPSTSGGAALGMMLNILEGWDMDTLGYSGAGVHAMVESFKYAFAHRMLLGDPQYVDDRAALDMMTSSEYAGELRARTSMEHTYPPEHYGPNLEQARNRGTSHMTVVDEQRNVVALTTTVNFTFGSKVMGPVSGIVFNCQMDDFATNFNTSNGFGLPPSWANRVQGGKRPLSSITPTVLLRGDELYMTLGASGGPTIITSVLQTMFQVVHFGHSMEKAVALPRFHHQHSPNVVKVENDLDGDIVAGLEARGHTVEEIGMLADGHLIGCVQAILVDDNGKLVPTSDPRKGGAPAGY